MKDASTKTLLYMLITNAADFDVLHEAEHSSLELFAGIRQAPSPKEKLEHLKILREAIRRQASSALVIDMFRPE